MSNTVHESHKIRYEPGDALGPRETMLIRRVGRVGGLRGGAVHRCTDSLHGGRARRPGNGGERGRSHHARGCRQKGRRKACRQARLAYTSRYTLRPCGRRLLERVSCALIHATVAFGPRFEPQASSDGCEKGLWFDVRNAEVEGSTPFRSTFFSCGVSISFNPAIISTTANCCRKVGLKSRLLSSADSISAPHPRSTHQCSRLRTIIGRAVHR